VRSPRRERDARYVDLALLGTLILYVVTRTLHLGPFPSPEHAMPNEHFENMSDQGHKKLFSEEAAAGARDPFHGTPAEREQQHKIAEDKELARQRIVNADPVPTGEGENIHEEDADVPKHHDSPPTLPESTEAAESSDSE
jgi:hypothetical protein